MQNNVENNTINIHVSTTQIFHILVFFSNLLQIFFSFLTKLYLHFKLSSYTSYTQFLLSHEVMAVLIVVFFLNFILFYSYV